MFLLRVVIFLDFNLNLSKSFFCVDHSCFSKLGLVMNSYEIQIIRCTELI